MTGRADVPGRFARMSRVRSPVMQMHMLAWADAEMGL